MLGFDFNTLTAVKRYESEFEELQRIGKGGFSTVYKAKHRLDHRLYAVKKIKIKPGQYRSNLQEYFEKIMREGKILSEINHPHVLKYNAIWFEVGQKIHKRDFKPVTKVPEIEFELIIESDDSQNNQDIGFIKPEKPPRTPEKIDKLQRIHLEKNKSDEKEKRREVNTLFDYTSLMEFQQVTIYIQTELCKESLYEHIEARKGKSGPEFEAENYKLIQQIISGLECIHDKKIIHRDLKLHNILVDFNGNCKISDFGLAKKNRGFRSCFIFNTQEYLKCGELIGMTEEDLHKLSSSVGTKIFSSPEQATSNCYDHRTDIYSLGLIIGILFSTWKTKHEQFEIINKIRSKNLNQINLKPLLSVVVERCISEPQARPSLLELRKCITTLMNPILFVKIRLRDQQSFKQRFVCIKDKKIYMGEKIGDKLKYSRMFSDMKVMDDNNHTHLRVSDINNQQLFEVQQDHDILKKLIQFIK